MLAYVLALDPGSQGINKNNMSDSAVTVHSAQFSLKFRRHLDFEIKYENCTNVLLFVKWEMVWWNIKQNRYETVPVSKVKGNH